MIKIERFFENIFTQKEITASRLLTFARDHTAKLKTSNPGGIYDGIIVATEGLTGQLLHELTDTGGGKARRKGGVLVRRMARKAFIDYLARKEGLIRSTFGKKSQAYVDFFPRGINAFRHATNAAFGTMTTLAVEAAVKYEADLGSAFRTELTNLKNAYVSASGDATTTSSELGREVVEQHQVASALQLQLMVNICTIGIYNAGNTRASRTYFSPHLLFPAKKHHLYKAKIEAGETKQVCTFKYSEGKRFHIMVTGTGPLLFQMTLNGIKVGRLVTVPPREKFNESFAFFSSDGDSLTVTNPGEQRGSYMVWEIS